MCIVCRRLQVIISIFLRGFLLLQVWMSWVRNNAYMSDWFWREWWNHAVGVHAGRKAYLRLDDLNHTQIRDDKKNTRKLKRSRYISAYLSQGKRDIKAFLDPESSNQALNYLLFGELECFAKMQRWNVNGLINLPRYVLENCHSWWACHDIVQL